jgi:Arc/MetJ family transcription regulator
MGRKALEIDDALLEEAISVLGEKNSVETVELALREAIRIARVRALVNYFGTDIWQGDLKEMRRGRFNDLPPISIDDVRWPLPK